MVKKAVENKNTIKNKRRLITGVVVSNKMQKTIVVKVDRTVLHAEYKKYITKTTRVKAHDEKNDAKPGDLVSVIESRPLSKDKRWALYEILRRSELGLQSVEA